MQKDMNVLVLLMMLIQCFALQVLNLVLLDSVTGINVMFVGKERFAQETTLRNHAPKGSSARMKLKMNSKYLAQKDFTQQEEQL